MRFLEDQVFKLSRVNLIVRKITIKNKMTKKSNSTIVSKFHKLKIHKNRLRLMKKPI